MSNKFFTILIFVSFCLLNIFLFQAIGEAAPQLSQQIKIAQDAVAESKRFLQLNSDGKYLAALRSVSKMKTYSEQLNGANHPDTIRIGLHRATVLRKMERYGDAENQATETLNEATRLFGDRHELVGATLQILGGINFTNRKSEIAKQQLEKSISILEPLGQSSRSDLANAYSDYSEVLRATGDPAAAKLYIEKSLTLLKTVEGHELYRLPTALSNYGWTLFALGQNEQAEQRLAESVRMTESNSGANSPEMIAPLVNLGQLYTRTNKFELAETHLRRALKISETKIGAKELITASVLNGLGIVLNEQQKNEEAKRVYETALAIREEKLGSENNSTATTQLNLGSLLLDLEQPTAASELFQSAIKNASADSNPDLSIISNAQTSLAWLNGAEGKTEFAIEGFSQARKTANQQVWNVLPQLGSNEQHLLMNKDFNWILYASLSMADLLPEDEAVLNSTAEWLANGKGVSEVALAAGKSPMKNISLEWIELEKIRRQIPDDGVLIDIARHDMVNFTGNRRVDRVSDAHYVAWLIPPAGKIVRVDLGDAEKIDGLIESLRSELATAGGASGKIVDVGEMEAAAEFENAFAELSKLIWQPLAEKIPTETKRLILSPDGALWLVPFNAIPIGTKAEPKFLIEQYAISTVSSGRSLAIERITSSKQASPPAIFSNPNFDQSSNEKRTRYQQLFKRLPTTADFRTRSVSFDREKFTASPLPGTAIESAAILPSLSAWVGEAAEPINYTGPFAMESVAKVLIHPRAIVFATHGYFLPDDDLTSDPLSRCGLLLCGCNDPQSMIGGDDGVLTGLEITSMDLVGTELVVLSACETGVGKIENGNGVAGLRRAFHLAGAQSVASTLWQVPDYDTAKLMSDFFAELATGTTKDDALRNAQIKRIEQRRKKNGAAHPFFWAGFSLSVR